MNESRKPYNDYNVILIFIDTLRADHLGCYGYDRQTSPNIDALSKESVLFEQNFTPATYTMASSVSLMTSLYPSSHGVLSVLKDRLSPRVKTLAEILQIYGYKTAWLGDQKSPHLDPDIGSFKGFEEMKDYQDRDTDTTINMVYNWLEANKEKRFFLAIHTYIAHKPYLPSLKYRERFIRDQDYENNKYIDSMEKFNEAIRTHIKNASIEKKGIVWETLGKDLVFELVSEGLLEEKSIRALKNFFREKGREEFEKFNIVMRNIYFYNLDMENPSGNKFAQASYDGCILEYDIEVVGPTIKKLKETGLYDKTIIVIFSDHGEEFYEHKGWEHGATLYDEVAHVPLIIRVPWIKGPKRIKGLTQTVDIMPTLLDLLGIPVPHQAQGKSVSSLFKKEDDHKSLRRYVFGQHHYLSSIRSTEWKSILHKDGARELYNIKSDPGEQDNLALIEKNKALELETALKEWEASLPSYKDREYAFVQEIDKETQERIRKTGYW